MRQDAAASKSKKIVANRDVAQLKVSILEAEAEVILKKNDEPKAKAREIISAAINRLPVNTCALKAAFQAGKDAKLDPSEYKRCEYMLKREEEREQALVDLKVVFDFAKEVDMTQIEAIQVAKTKLSDAITRAKDKGVADKDLKGYELRRRKLLMLWNSRSEDFD